MIKISFFFLLSLLIATQACARDSYGPVFLAETEFRSVSVIKSVPLEGDERDQADFKKLFFYQNNRTDQDCARAESEVEVSLQNLFGKPYGQLDAQEVQKYKDFFQQVRLDTGFFVSQAKNDIKRLRPYLRNDKLNPCVKKESSFAYPSGHSALARVFALILSEIDPAKKDLFIARGDQIAEDRVLGGVHHPSDIEAGKEIAQVIFNHLMKNKKFIEELNKLKK